MTFKHEPKDDREYLRQVVFDGYCLRTWDTGRRDPPNALGRRTYLGYEFVDPQGKVLFTGTDYSPSPLLCIDNDKSLRELIGFLTLKPGDTDEDYFEKYTPEQMAFVEGPDVEYLSMWADDEMEKYPKPRDFAGNVDPDGKLPYQFTNIDDWVDPDQEE